MKYTVQHVYKEIQEFDDRNDRNARDVSRDRESANSKKETSKGSIRLEHLGDKENVISKTKKENIQLDLLRGRGERGERKLWMPPKKTHGRKLLNPRSRKRKSTK